jgi:DNA-binding response OmpR family regulator
MPTIAIVNDETSIRQQLRREFEQEGYTVIEYVKSSDALQLCEHPVDLAIIDGHNPPLGGVELFKRIREHNAMRVIFLSAGASEIKEELRAQDMDAFGYFDLPCSFREIVFKVSVVLGPP